MNQPITKIILMSLLLMLVLAPFAGLAPLLLVLLITGIGSTVWSLLKVLLTGKTEPEEIES